MSQIPRTTPTLGILSLDTAFLRIPGDAGNPASYQFPALVEVVPDADSTSIVRDGLPDEELLQRFEAATQRLEAKGASAIVSTCGFLITAQERMAAAVKVPVMLSALSLFPAVKAVTAARIGILTASKSALGQRAFASAGIEPSQVVVQGMEHEAAFTETFLVNRAQQRQQLNRDEMERAVVRAAMSLVEGAPDLGAIILECGNLPPYADAILAATGLPVFHLLDAASWLMAAQGFKKN